MPDRVYNIKVVSRAKQAKVEKIDDDNLKAWLTTPPVDNKANPTLIELMAEEFNIKGSQISIIKGATSLNKVIKIDSV